MNRQLQVLIAGLLWLPLAGCDYLPSWVPGAKSEKNTVKTSAKKSVRKPTNDDLSVEQQILQLQQEIRAVEEEKRKLEQRRAEIQDEKEGLSELLQDQETDLQRREREIKRLESAAPAGG